MSRATTPRMGRVVPEPGAVGLLAVVLTGVPRLDGAACIGVRGRFHEAETGSRIRIAECIAICRRCPVKAECARWADAEAALVGVVAGEFHGSVRRDDEPGNGENPNTEGQQYD